MSKTIQKSCYVYYIKDRKKSKQKIHLAEDEKTDRFLCGWVIKPKYERITKSKAELLSDFSSYTTCENCINGKGVKHES